MDAHLLQGCTAFVVDPIHIMTAAHCLWNAGLNVLAGYTDFLAAYDPLSRNQAPFGSARSINFWLSPAFTACYQNNQNKSSSYGLCQQEADYGLVRVNKTFRAVLSIDFASQQLTGRIATAGYPGAPHMIFQAAFSLYRSGMPCMSWSEHALNNFSI